MLYFKNIFNKKRLQSIFVYCSFSFLLLLSLFTRSIIGLSIFDYRIGELLIGFSLLVSIYFTFIAKPSRYFSFLNSNFNFLYRIIILIFILRLIINIEFLDLYFFKSSSFIWTISFIFCGRITSSFIDKNKIISVIFALSPLVVYLFHTGNYPNLIINFFTKYSDKFQFIKASDMVIVIIISSLFLNYSFKHLIFPLFYANTISFLFIPLVAINSRGALLGLFIFILLINIENIAKIKKLRKNVLFLLLLNFLVFSFSSLRVNNSSSDFESVEQVSIVDLPQVVREISEEKNTQDVFLSFYFSNGRIFSVDPTTNWRLDIWQDVIEDLNNKGRILYGYGYGEIIPVMKDPTAPGRLGRDGLNENVHNYFITVFARGGLINLILFIFLHFEIYKLLNVNNNFIGKFSFIIPCLFMSSLDITMDGVQFPLLYYFFIGYFLQKSD